MPPIVDGLELYCWMNRAQYLSCDHAGCPATFDLENRAIGLDNGKAAARAVGWIVGLHGDFCPAHASAA